MIKNQDIVVFNLSRWDSPIISSGLMITHELAKYNKVLYIDHPYNFHDLITQRKSESLKRRIKDFFPLADGLHEIKDHETSMHILYLPPVLPINFLPDGKLYDVFNWINHKIISRRIKKATKQLKMDNILFINSFNFYYPNACKIVKPKLNIYYCVDELIKPFSLKHGRRNEDEITRDADVVINTSDALYTNRVKINPNCYKVYNACDCSFFMKKMANINGNRHFLTNISKPVIGYYGCIERRIDYEILFNVFATHPEWSLVMVGPVEHQYVPQKIKALSNVHLPGCKPYDQIPSILFEFDVALIPYKQDKVSQTIFPMKLFEYLTSGKPVVSLNFNPGLLAQFDNLIYIAEESDSLAKAITNALSETGDELKNKRIELAKQNTWASRAEEFACIIDNELHMRVSQN